MSFESFIVTLTAAVALSAFLLLSASPSPAITRRQRRAWKLPGR